MVFQKPNPFPKTIYENVAYGLRVNGVNDENYIEETVVKTLKQVVLWDEVKDKLKESAFALSGGQQQRLCIALGDLAFYLVDGRADFRVGPDFNQ